MELHQRRILLPKNNNIFKIWFVTDPHIGHQNFDRDKFEKHFNLFEKDKDAYMFFLGDGIDARTIDHKFFDMKQREHRNKDVGFIRDCLSQLKHYFKPVKDRIIGVHTGNHCEGLHKHEYDYIKELCEDLNIKYLGYRALTKLVTYKDNPKQHSTNLTLNVFTTHGSGSGRKSGAKINRIEDEFLSTEADIYAQGHNHYLSFSNKVRQQIYNAPNKLMLRELDYFFINAGSYMKSYQEGNYSYSEKSSYPVQKTGCVVLDISPISRTINGRFLI